MTRAQCLANPIATWLGALYFAFYFAFAKHASRRPACSRSLFKYCIVQLNWSRINIRHVLIEHWVNMRLPHEHLQTKKPEELRQGVRKPRTTH